MNDDKRNPSSGKFSRYFRGKGFFTVLSLCVFAIAITTWVLSASVKKAGQELSESLDSSLAASFPSATATPYSLPKVASDSAIPPATASPTPSATPTVTAAPAAEEQQDSVEVASVGEPEPEPIPDAFVRPVSGTVETPFSVDALVYNRTMADWRVHKGVDYSTVLGARVVAVAEGTVSRIYTNEMMGVTVEISHGGGLVSVYSNLAAEPNAVTGDHVSMGDTIGSVGTTAIAEAADVTHLHFEMLLNGGNVDPENYFTQLRG